MIIGLTGRIAAGKGQIVNYLLEKGFSYTTISNLVREEAAKRGIGITRENLQNLGNEVRKEEGANAWIKRLVSNIKENEEYIVDGIRNSAEVEELRKQRYFFLISVDAPQKIRFERMLKRAKPSDPKTWDDFLSIDKRDFGEENPNGQQVGKCMKLADFTIVNDGSLEYLNNQIDGIYNKISGVKR